MSGAADWLRAVVSREASSRSAALLRVALAAIALSKFAFALLPSHGHHPARLIVGASFYASTLAMLIGLRARAATAWSGATQLVMFYWLGKHLDLPGFVSHHGYLLAVVTLVLSLTPCDRSYSVDRWRWLGASRPPPERGPTYGLVLLGVQLSAVYLFAAVDKLDWAFLSGARLEQLLMYFQLGSDPPTGAWWRASLAVASVATVAIELVLAVGLWMASWRRWVIPLGIAFHAALYYALQVDTFTITVWALYLSYLDPDEVHEAIERVQR